jgi:ribonuclease HII
MSVTPSPGYLELDSPSLPRKIESDILKNNPSTHFVIGVDEAGRGPLAGPVVAAAFSFRSPSMKTPKEFQCGVTDSKQVGEEAREFMYHNNFRGNDKILFRAAVIDNRIIDKINILQATFRAMSEACLGLINEIRKTYPQATFSVLIDGNKIPPQLAESGHDCHFVIKGDSLEFLIAAASICAKVERDSIMREIDCEFPQYGFRQHKGYPTGAHVAAISKHGPCKYHRMTFAPLKTMNKSRQVKRPAADSIADETKKTSVDARAERLKRRNLAKES